MCSMRQVIVYRNYAINFLGTRNRKEEKEPEPGKTQETGSEQERAKEKVTGALGNGSWDV